jgi:hypothetical protein
MPAGGVFDGNAANSQEAKEQRLRTWSTKYPLPKFVRVNSIGMRVRRQLSLMLDGDPVELIDACHVRR